MNWFKMLWLTSEEREILKRAKEPVPVITSKNDDTLSAIVNEKPYRSLIYSNNNIIVTFADGTTLNRANSNYEIYKKVRSAKTVEEIEKLMIPVEIVKMEEHAGKELVKRNLDIFNSYPDFSIRNDSVILNGVNLEIPAPIVASFIEILEKLSAANGEGKKDLENKLIALKMFWLKLAINPLPQSREDLLTFITLNDVKISKNGNLILYRRIVSKENTDKQLVEFISQEYYRIKKSGGDPRVWAVQRGPEGLGLVYLPTMSFEADGLLGNLQVMYLELPTYNSNIYTSAHDRNVTIKVGGIYSIPEDKINLNNGICAAGGLHAACVTYNYSGFGDVPVVVLVNPSKAITVPKGDAGKLRTTEMFIACVNDKPHGQHFDENALDLFDNEYHSLTLKELEEVARTKDFSPLSVKDTVPAISLVDLNNIKEMLKDRIKTVS